MHCTHTPYDCLMNMRFCPPMHDVHDVQAFFGWDLFILSSLVPAHGILVAIGRMANRFLVHQPALSAQQVRALADFRAKSGPIPNSAQLHDPNVLRLLRRPIRLEAEPILYFGGWLESVLIAIGLTGAYVWRIHWPNALILENPVPGIKMDDIWYMICAVYAITRALHWLTTAGDG